MSDETPKVSLIVLTWNSRVHILECLQSLQKVDYPNYEVVVVDNNSIDGTPNLVEQYFPNVILIKNKKNLGFGGGFNVGIKEAIKRGAVYVICFNADIIVNENFVKELVRIGETSPTIGGLCPIAYYYHDPNRINGAGGIVSVIRSKVFGQGKLDKGQYSKVKETRMLCGPAIALKTKVLMEVGFFDTDYFFGPEDMDIALRLIKKGYKLMFVPGAKLWHKRRGATGGKVTPLNVYFHVRNYLLFVKKHASGLDCLFPILYFGLFDFSFALLRGLIFGKRGYINAALKGVLWCIDRKLLPTDDRMVQELSKLSIT
jgi:hypothetical protein